MAPILLLPHLCMRPLAATYGEAVFSRTDTPDYTEHTVPFRDLDEMALICGTAVENMTLEKVVLHRGGLIRPQGSVTLGFIAADQGMAVGAT